MKPETRVKRNADRIIIRQLTRENKITELGDYRDLLEKEKSNRLTQVEETQLYYWRYSIKL